MKNGGRLLEVLKHVIDLYIETGEPVSSLSVCERLFKTVSSATVRSDMAKLEAAGYLKQPHTSSGRLPTYLGFRLYIDSIVEFKEPKVEEKAEIDDILKSDLSSVSAVMENAVCALSEFTDLAAVSTNNIPDFSIISKVEIIPTGRRIYAVLLITSSGKIKNKICRVNFEIDNDQLEYFKSLVNCSLVGNPVSSFNSDVLDNLAAAMGGYVLSLSPLLQTLYEISNELSRRQVEIKGENNFLKYSGVDSGELFEFINTKNRLEKILLGAFSGVNVIFGKENDRFVIGNSSLIISKYGNKNLNGSFGVIGPIRLDYGKIISYISYFSKSISRLIDSMQDELEEDGSNCKTCD